MGFQVQSWEVPVNTIEIYPLPSGNWRWRVRAGNNRIIARGGEPFATKYTARRAALNARKSMAGDLFKVVVRER